MSLRDVLNRSPAVTGVLIFVVVGSAVTLLATRGNRQQARSLQYDFFYDLSADKIIVDNSLGVLAPIRDGQAVKAHVFACGDCDDPAKRQIGWLEKYDEAAHAAAASVSEQAPGSPPDPVRQQKIDAGRLLAGPPVAGQAPVWIKFNSPAAGEIVAAKSQRCPDREARAITCAPLDSELP